MSESKKRSVNVKATYWIGGGEKPTFTIQFDDHSVEAARVGLPEGAKPVKPEPGDFSYSGMHDQGPLPELREGGDIAVLLGCAQHGKTFNDEFLTKAIQDEKKSREHQDDSHPTKRSKIES